MERKACMVMQQCVEASLQLDPLNPDSCAAITKGAVVFVCFFEAAAEDSELCKKLAKIVMEVKLSIPADDVDAQRASLLDIGADLLIVPQATLGGRLKSKQMQYHQNVNKQQGVVLYRQFVDECRRLAKPGMRVDAGTYGILQSLRMSNTQGPFTHIIEL